MNGSRITTINTTPKKCANYRLVVNCSQIICIYTGGLHADVLGEVVNSSRITTTYTGTFNVYDRDEVVNDLQITTTYTHLFDTLLDNRL